MYGTDDCTWCKRQVIVDMSVPITKFYQKDLFGQSFSLIDYVNCKNENECYEKNLEGMPTWVMHSKDGNEIKGMK